jgi:hypothetical protein
VEGNIGLLTGGKLEGQELMVMDVAQLSMVFGVTSHTPRISFS